MLVGLSAVLILFKCQAQFLPFDECVYTGVPVDLQIQYAGNHIRGTINHDDGSSISISFLDAFSWGTTNNISDPAYNNCGSTWWLAVCGFTSFGEDCGQYFGYAPDLSYDFATWVNDHLQGTDSGGWGDINISAFSENHDGSSFSVSMTWTNDPDTLTWSASEDLSDPYLPSCSINDGTDNADKCTCPDQTAAIDGEVVDASDLASNISSENSTVGMPRWFMNEPYLKLWIKDEPAFYTTSLGKQIGFRMAYKQHDTRPKPPISSVPSTGWGHNWFSYVHFVVPTYLASTNGSVGGPMPGSTGPVTIRSGWSFTNDFSQWQAILYATDNGENYFDHGATTEARSGLKMMTADAGAANGFKLVHPDGSVDEYTTVTNRHFTFGIARSQGRVYDMGLDGAKLLKFGGQSYYDADSGNRHVSGANDEAGSHYVESTTEDSLSAGDLVGYVACDAVLTKRTDPYGNPISLSYSSGPYYFLLSILDYDGTTSTLAYDHFGMLTNVTMPYGRTASFSYTDGQMTGCTDAQGMNSSFSYTPFPYLGELGADTNVYLASMTTPYGTTSFDHYEAPSVISVSKPPSLHYHISGGGTTTSVEFSGTSPIFVGGHGGTNRVCKSWKVTHPDGTHELYVYRFDSRGLVPETYSGEFPYSSGDDGVDHSDDTESTINHLLSTRNSFHWNRQQYALLSTTNIFHLTASDFKLSTMKHWLMLDQQQSCYPQRPEYNLSDQISLLRAASPDAVQDGAKTWFSHSGQSGWKSTGDYSSVIAETILPTGDIRQITTSYSGGFLASIEDSHTTLTGNTEPRYLVYDHDVYGRPTGTVFRDGGSTTISYPDGDAEMDVTFNIGYGDGGTDYYFYNSRHQVTGIKHANGLTTTNIYGGDGFLVKSIDLEAKATNLFSFANGLPSSTTSPLGVTLNYTWDNLCRLTQVAFPDGTTISNHYSRLDVVDHKDRLDHWTHASYDNMQQLYSATDANGNTTSYDYCSCGALASITDPLGNWTSFKRDYDGNVTNVTASDGFNVNYSRNIIGQATSVTTSAGLSLNYAYNNQGLVTNVANSAFGRLFGAAYDECDRPVYLTDAQGVTITNQYDGFGRVLWRWNSFGYEHNNYLPQGVYQHRDALNQWTYYGYDAAGRLDAVTNANGEINLFSHNPAGEIATLVDGNGNTNAWAYDIYGGNTRKTDGNGVLVSTNGYDAKGRMTKHWTPAKGLTQYTYDANGNPLTVSFSAGTGITAAYDALNRIYSMSDAAGTSGFTYTNFGAFQSALATEDGRWASDKVAHVYTNRLAQSLTLSQPSGSWVEYYSYDSLLRMHTLNMTAGTFTYTYSDAGRQIQNLALPGGNSIAETYDPAGQILTTALKHGSTVLDSSTYTYDANGNRTSVTRANNAYVNYGYDAIGQLTSAVGYEPDAITLRANEDFGYGYDAADNLLTRTNHTLIQTFTTDHANELVNVTRNNDLLTVAGSLSSAPTNLTVNGANATIYNDLTFAVTNGITITNGLNVLTAQTVSNSVTMTNRLVEFLPTAANLHYDLNGNLISDRLHGYDYDCANELTRVTVTNILKAEFTYDGFGRRRVRKEYAWQTNQWAQTGETRYIYDGMLVIQERSSNNVPVASYTRGVDLSGTMQGAGGIGGLLARTDTNTTAYYHADGNGNITMLIDGSGTMQAKYLYDSYGNTLGMWGTLASANPYRFSSKEIESSAGLYYYGFRYYQPNLQRWLNRDPIGEFGGINLYNYVGNDPINHIDALGLQVLANPYNAEAFSPGSTFLSGHPDDVSVGQYLSLMGVGIGGAALAATGIGLTADYTLAALGLGGAFAETPEGQAEMAEAEQMLANAANTVKSCPNIVSSRGGNTLAAKVAQIKNDMLNGNYDFTAPRGRIAGFINDAGDYMINEGNHRMQAAMQIYQETGDSSNVMKLIENGLWTPTGVFWSSYPLPPVK